MSKKRNIDFDIQQIVSVPVKIVWLQNLKNRIMFEKLAHKH